MTRHLFSVAVTCVLAIATSAMAQDAITQSKAPEGRPWLGPILALCFAAAVFIVSIIRSRRENNQD